MRRITRILTLSFFLVTVLSWGLRGEDPVDFKYEVKKIQGNVYEIRIVASIEQPWHIYSQFTPEEGPSLPTHINFTKNPLIELIGKPEEKGKLVTKHEEILDVNLKYYKEKVEFVQKIKLKGNVKTNLMGAINYMACTDERCLLPTTEKFSVGIQ
jgi:thiol:disulfide interchange protein DsbD